MCVKLRTKCVCCIGCYNLSKLISCWCRAKEQEKIETNKLSNYKFVDQLILEHGCLPD